MRVLIADQDETTYGRKLIANQSLARANVRQAWLADAGELPRARLCALSAIAAYMFRHQGRTFEHSSPSIDGRLSLTALFMQGLDLSEAAIIEGLYAQAAALVRQQMETIEAIHRHETGRRHAGSPKLFLLRAKYGRLYYELTGLAHVCRDELNEVLVALEHSEGIRAPSALPLYNKIFAGRLYSIHLQLMLHFAHQLEALTVETGGDVLNDSEAQSMLRVVDILSDHGLITLSK